MPELCGKVITAIIFDLDNTLIPTRNGDLEACNKVCNYITSYLFYYAMYFYIYLYKNENG